MNKKIIIKKSAIYLGASVINKIIPFLLLPIMTKYLSPSEYGVLAIFQLILSLYSAFIGMNLQMNVTKNYFKFSHEEMAKLIGNILFILSISAFVVLSLTLISTFFFEELFSIPSRYFYLFPVLSFMIVVNAINLTILRNKGEAYTYGKLSIISTLVNSGVTIVLLVMYHLGWHSKVIATVIASFSFFIIAIIYIKKHKYIKFDIEVYEVKSILSVSIPIIPHLLAGIVIVMSDRLFIERMIGIEMVGIYSIGYTFGMVVMIFTDSFIKSWSPWFYKILANPTLDKKKQIVKFSYIYIVSAFIIAIVISFVSEKIIPYVLNEKFHGASDFVVWIALGYAIQGIYKILFPYMVHVNKTKLLALSTVVAATINLVLNYFFIEIYGAVGAAFATMGAFMTSSCLLLWFQHKYYKMPWFGGN